MVNIPEVLQVVEAVGEVLIVEEAVEDVQGQENRHNVQNLWSFKVLDDPGLVH